MTGSFDQSSAYGVKWSMRFSTPASGVLSPCSPRPLITSIHNLLRPDPEPASFARMLHSYCNRVKTPRVYRVYRRKGSHTALAGEPDRYRSVTRPRPERLPGAAVL